MGYDRQKVIDIALGEVGYLEKKSNSQLDDKTANAGFNNYTKYARDLYAEGYYNGTKQSVAWCDVFVDWCFYKAFGKSIGQQLTCQTGDLGASCTYSAQYYKNNDQFGTTPMIGAQIFFGDSLGCTHTGIVYDYDDSKVYTIEGNTSTSEGVDPNGGGVCKKSYDLSYSKIVGYGYPLYDDNFIKGETTKTETINNIGLTWWGDIVIILLCILLIIGGTALLVIGVKDIVTDKIGGLKIAETV